jgi:hypothetical protein
MLEVIKKYENARKNPTYSFTRMFLVKDGDCGGIIIRYRIRPDFSIIKFETFMEAVLFVQAATTEMTPDGTRGFFKEVEPESPYWHVMRVTSRIEKEFRSIKEFRNKRGLCWLFPDKFISKVSMLL